MYSRPNTVQSTGTTIARISLPVIASICCAGTILFLIVGTIVLALIPIYMPQKTLTAVTSPNSNEINLYLPLADSTRKRQSSDSISDAVGGSVNDSGTLADIKSKIMTVIGKTKQVQGISGLTAEVASISSSSRRRRRFPLSKRAGSTGITVLKCTFYIIFKTTCTATTCQNTAGTAIGITLKTDTSIFTVFVFSNLIVTVGGQRKSFKCKASGFPTFTPIGASGSFADATKPATVTVTASTVTGSTTANMTLFTNSMAG